MRAPATRAWRAASVSPAPGLGVGLQALDVGELIADGVTEFGAVTKFSQLSQMLAYGQAPAASSREQ